MRRASALEAKYLLKLMLGDMRIGVKQSLIEEAIAVASGADVVAVRHAVMLEADLARAVERAFGGTLGEARMRLFHPLGFMLASPVETPEEAVERFTSKDDLDAGACTRFSRTSTTGCGPRCIAGIRSSQGGLRFTRAIGKTLPRAFRRLQRHFASVREPLILDGELLGWKVS